MSDEKDQAAPKKKDVLKELLAKLEELKTPLPAGPSGISAEWAASPADRRLVELTHVMSTCAVHALGILAEIAQYQRVIAETSAITLQMKQLQGASGGLASMSPGGLVIPRG